jgi:hypothetical protein
LWYVSAGVLYRPNNASIQKWENSKREERGDAQTGVQDKALESAAETLPAGLGRQDTHHQVLQHFVIFSHAA